LFQHVNELLAVDQFDWRDTIPRSFATRLLGPPRRGGFSLVPRSDVMMTDWYQKSIKARALNGKATRTQEAYRRARRMLCEGHGGKAPEALRQAMTLLSLSAKR
jgi:hypothetical protein